MTRFSNPTGATLDLKLMASHATRPRAVRAAARLVASVLAVALTAAAVIALGLLHIWVPVDHRAWVRPLLVGDALVATVLFRAAGGWRR